MTIAADATSRVTSAFAPIITLSPPIRCLSHNSRIEHGVIANTWVERVSYSKIIADFHILINDAPPAKDSAVTNRHTHPA
ncbi:hypothetical protein [Thermophilibacter sp.]